MRDAFINKGHEAISCDLLPSESDIGIHYQGNVISLLRFDWDMLIAFPPCKYLSKAGARWWKGSEYQQRLAIHFVRRLMDADIDKICIENPVGILSTVISKPTQYIQPYEYGHEESKRTCLWLKNLPSLIPTDVRDIRAQRIIQLPDNKARVMDRSRTYTGIAQAMANQWS